MIWFYSWDMLRFEQCCLPSPQIRYFQAAKGPRWNKPKPREPTKTGANSPPHLNSTVEGKPRKDFIITPRDVHSRYSRSCLLSSPAVWSVCKALAIRVTAITFLADVMPTCVFLEVLAYKSAERKSCQKLINAQNMHPIAHWLGDVRRRRMSMCCNQANPGCVWSSPAFPATSPRFRPTNTNSLTA